MRLPLRTMQRCRSWNTRTVWYTVCVCVFSSHSFWTSSSLDVPAGVTQEEGHTGFLIHLPSAVRALIFVARRIQPFLSLVDREVEFCRREYPHYSTKIGSQKSVQGAASWSQADSTNNMAIRAPGPGWLGFLLLPPVAQTCHQTVDLLRTCQGTFPCFRTAASALALEELFPGQRWRRLRYGVGVRDYPPLWELKTFPQTSFGGAWPPP